MKPRVFFGTMYSGEAEFQQCLDAVSAQKGLEHFYQHVIRNKPEAEAHNELWSIWEREKYRFDLFVKVDADTILGDSEAVSRVWQLFAENPRVTGAQLRLHDYFTDDLIAGLNFFSPVVKFNVSPDLYCDRVDTNHDIVMKGSKVKQLEPIGFHCKNPSDLQSFHFGLHRMLKGQTATLHKVWSKYVTAVDQPREMALLGAAAAHFDGHAFAGPNNSYNATTFNGAFTIVQNMPQLVRTDTIARLQQRLGWSCEF